MTQTNRQVEQAERTARREAWVREHDPLALLAWRDPAYEAHGYMTIASEYADRFWLPVIGPTSYLLMQRLAERVLAEPHGARADVPLAELSSELGVGLNGYTSQLVRTFVRLTDFRLVRISGDFLEVRLAWPPLTTRQIERLPEHLRDLHALQVVGP